MKTSREKVLEHDPPNSENTSEVVTNAIAIVVIINLLIVLYIMLMRYIQLRKETYFQSIYNAQKKRAEEMKELKSQLEKMENSNKKLQEMYQEAVSEKEQIIIVQ